MNKIQQFLLTNYPTIWNVKLFPILLLLILVHLLMVFIGFKVEKLDFEHIFYSFGSADSDRKLILKLILCCSVLIAILLFIGWLVYYARHNRLSNHYPAKTRQIYGEWLLVFSIILMITAIPFSFMEGCRLRGKSTADIEEVNDALKTLYLAQILIPNDSYSYRCNYIEQTNLIPLPDSLANNLNNPDIRSTYFLDDNQYEIFKENKYIGNSILYLKKETVYANKVKQWLIDGETDSIQAVMIAFEKLITKADIKYPNIITAEQWFNRIYHPPFFPVNKRTMIGDYNYEYNMTKPILPFTVFTTRYEYILSCHTNSIYSNDTLLTIFCIATLLSLLVMAAKITNLKNWIKSFIIVGLISLFSIILTVILSEFKTFMIMCVITFIISFIYIIHHVLISESKNHSAIIINIFIFLIPFFIPLLYKICPIDYSFTKILWYNLAIILVVMYPILKLLRSWKGLAEE